MTESPWRALANRRMLICVLTGFPRACRSTCCSTCAGLAEDRGLSLKAIGAFALIQFPYTWKFVWSPFLDRYALPLLGRRRGWMALTMLLLLGRSPGSAPCRPPPSWGWWSG
jgi:PAT family beta-lactamase induction signal transducer AmpG